MNPPAVKGRMKVDAADSPSPLGAKREKTQPRKFSCNNLIEIIVDKLWSSPVRAPRAVTNCMRIAFIGGIPDWIRIA